MKIQKTILVSLLSILTGMTSVAREAFASTCPNSYSKDFHGWAQNQKEQAIKCLQVELQETTEDFQKQRVQIALELEISDLSEDERFDLEKKFHQSHIFQEDETLRIEGLIKSLQKK
jgi:hypothetical protein